MIQYQIGGMARMSFHEHTSQDLQPSSDPHHLGPAFAANYRPDPVPSLWRQTLLDTAYQYGMRPEVLGAQIEQESGWNPTIKSSDYATTASVGLSQATRATWNGSPFGQAQPVTDANVGTAQDPRNNPITSIEFVGWLDRQGAYSYTDTREILDTYNGGNSPQGVQNAEANHYVDDIIRRLPKYQKDASGILPPTPQF